MAMTLEPLQPFGVVARDIDLAQPVDDATFARILAAFNEHALVVFPTQGLDDDSQTEFSARFGRLEGSLREMRMFEDRPVRQEVLDVSNVGADGNLIPRTSKEAIPFVANELWHSDFSFKPVPAMASLLHGRIVAPEGGQTEFADMRAAWDALPDNRKVSLEGLIAEHWLKHSLGTVGYEITEAEKVAMPSVQQVLVRRHPVTGRKSLFLSSHASHIIGWPFERGRALLDELTEFATQPQFVYRHTWQTGDLVAWDNRSTMHRVRPWDVMRYKRVMRRTTVAGAGPTAADGRATQFA